LAFVAWRHIARWVRPYHASDVLKRQAITDCAELHIVTSVGRPKT
jgi:hypothetical protein